MARLTAALLVSALTLSSTVAGAQNKAPTEADLALAKQYFQLGRTYYDQGLHEKALESFQESYRHSRKPALLYNIARCHEFLGQVKPAIEHYERFLAESGKSNPTIKARIRNLRARLDRTRTTTPVVPPPVKPKPKPVEPPPVKPAPPKQPKKVQKKTPPQHRASRPMPPPSQQGERPAAWMTWTGWGLVGFGAAALVTSFVFGARAKAKASLMEDALSCSTGEGPADCPPPPGTAYEWSTVKQIEDDGKRFEVAQITTLVLGIVAGGAGATLLLLRPKRRTAYSAQIAPIVGDRTFGVSSSISF